MSRFITKGKIKWQKKHIYSLYTLFSPIYCCSQYSHHHHQQRVSVFVYSEYTHLFLVHWKFICNFSFLIILFDIQTFPFIFSPLNLQLVDWIQWLYFMNKKNLFFSKKAKFWYNFIEKNKSNNKKKNDKLIFFNHKIISFKSFHLVFCSFKTETEKNTKCNLMNLCYDTLPALF